MNSTLRRFALLVVPALVACSIVVSAQRRGGDGPPTLTEYDNKDYGLFFPVPEGLSLFTPEQPGRFASLLGEATRRIALLVNLLDQDVSIAVKCSSGVTDADLKSLKQTLDSNPPQAKLPGYKQISVDTPKVGLRSDKDAVGHVYSVMEDTVVKTIRQMMFVHKGRGFTVICSAPAKQFEQVNKKTFDRFFATIDFR